MILNPLYLKVSPVPVSTNLPLLCVQVDLVFPHEGFRFVLSSTPFDPGPLLNTGISSFFVCNFLSLFFGNGFWSSTLVKCETNFDSEGL